MFNDVWLMKEYGEGGYWTRIYKIELSVVASNFQYWEPSKNCKKVIMEECHMDRTYLISYDIENKIHKTVELVNNC